MKPSGDRKDMVVLAAVPGSIAIHHPEVRASPAAENHQGSGGGGISVEFEGCEFAFVVRDGYEAVIRRGRGHDDAIGGDGRIRVELGRV